MSAGKDASGSKNDIQQKGSTQTYLQRYTLIGALGLSTADEDVDGNDGRIHKTAEQPKQEQSEEEALEDWADLIKQASRQNELTGLYLKNKKTVDGWDRLKAMFKDREIELKKSIANPKTVVLP